MSTIVFNSEDIGDVYAPSLNAALERLYAESGIQPVVRSPYGGKRTIAEQRTINPSIAPSLSDHVKGRGVDIWNYLAIQLVIGVAQFKAIMAAHGWHNVQVNGAPFDEEPWHYANHDTVPAGPGGDPLPGTTVPKIEEDNMDGCIYWVAINANGEAITKENAPRTGKPASNSGHVVEPFSMYFQEHPGAPIWAFTGGKDYTKTAGGIEYIAFRESRRPLNAPDATDARIPVKNTEMVALINLRGLVAAPIT